MEGSGCSQRWRTHLPEFKRGKRFSPETGKSGRSAGENKEEANKTVTIAATSRYLTDRRYVVRRPLTSEEQHVSILKGTHPQKGTGKEHPQVVSVTEPANVKHRSEPGEAAGSHGVSHGDVSLPTASAEDHSSPLTVSELQARSCRDESSLGLPFHGSKSVLQNPFSSILEVQRLNPPLRPQLTSTVLYPTYIPRSRKSKSSQTRDTNSSIPRVSSKGDAMSSCQVDFWACAIPKALPPSPNRQSAGWNPNKEYEALLDYTYPLRPGHVDCEWDSSEPQGDSLLKASPNMQDSGIELDHLCSSASLSGFEFSESGEEKTRDSGALRAGYRSPDLQGVPKSSEGPSFSTPVSLTNPMGLFLDSSDCRRDRGETGYHNRNHQGHAAPSCPSSPSPPSPTFICSTSVLPRSRCVCGEVDEEFLPLPEQLEETQKLSRQVREVTARLTRSVTASSESLDQSFFLPSITLSGKQRAEGEGTSDGREQSRAPRTESRERDSETFRSGFGARVEPGGGGPSESDVEEVETLMKGLCAPTFSNVQKNSQDIQEKNDCLMQRLKVFCSHLELLIHQLYALAERMERLAAPSVDIDSVKSSLAEYQSFQREISEHQPLTSCVLHAGQHLLSCINATSPFLRDTLLLIESQSGALQTHSEHFFSSILSAMDSLTQLSYSGPSEWRRAEDPAGT